MKLTEAEVIRVARRTPGRTVSQVLLRLQAIACGSFREFLLITKPVGSTMSHDAELNDGNPLVPLGTCDVNQLPLREHAVPQFTGHVPWPTLAADELGAGRNPKARPDAGGVIELSARRDPQTSCWRTKSRRCLRTGCAGILHARSTLGGVGDDSGDTNGARKSTVDRVCQALLVTRHVW